MRQLDVLPPLIVGVVVAAGALALGGYMGITARLVAGFEHVVVAILRHVL